MARRSKLDIPLAIIVLLLVATLVAFFMGVFPYPFGFLILILALVGRVLHLANTK